MKKMLYKNSSMCITKMIDYQIHAKQLKHNKSKFSAPYQTLNMGIDWLGEALLQPTSITIPSFKSHKKLN